jgi:hypothetical protein
MDTHKKASAKKISADGEAERIMELQQGAAGRSKFSSLLTALLCAIIIYGFAAAFLILPDRERSDTENRTLAQAPSFSLSSLLSGDFTADFADYMADQFPLRDSLVGLKGAVELILRGGENNGVILGENGQLAVREDYPDEDKLSRSIAAIAVFSDYAEDCGVNTVFAAAGRVIDTEDSALPALYGTACQDRIWGILEDDCEESGVNLLSLRETLRQHAAAGEYVYYRTDHHWTTLGAYYASVEVNDVFGGKALLRGDFTTEIASEDFYGTTWSKAGMHMVGPDTMEYWRWEGDENVTCVIDGATVMGLYDREALETRDKYSSFIGGNNGITEIESPDAEGSLLVIKDSFFHSMAPILSKNWNMTVVDLRYYSKPVKVLLEEGDYDGVLILQNMETLTTSTDLEKLRSGIG